MECQKCLGYAGWVCERHPDLPFMHKDANGAPCTGAGVPCDAPACEHSLFGTTPQTPGVMDRMRVGVESRGGSVICSVDEA